MQTSEFLININRSNLYKKHSNIFHQNLMSDTFTITSFKDIKKTIPNNGKYFTTVGLIVDATNPHRKDVKKDYCMKLKIIDQSLPNEQLYVFLYGKNDDIFPTQIQVGDIIFIQNYVFDIWNGTLQAKKPFNVITTEFRFFSGNPQLSGYHLTDSSVGLNDPNGTLLNNINDLRKYSKNYFKTHPVPVFPKNASQTSSDYDLIVKVTGSQLVNKSYKVSMTNSVNKLVINYNTSVQPGVYKLRSIAGDSWQGNVCHLVGNDYTCFLQVSNWMKSYDSKQWQKLAVQKGEVKAERQVVASKTKQKRGEKRQVTKLIDLVKKQNHNEDVKVSVEFTQVFTSFQKALRKYDQQNNLQKDFQTERGDYIYDIHFAISDQSLDGQIFNVYLYTYDLKGLEFLPGLNPKQIFGKNILNHREKYEHVVNRLLQESDFQTSPMELVLSPMFNGKQTIYRIIDTELLI